MSVEKRFIMLAVGLFYKIGFHDFLLEAEGAFPQDVFDEGDLAFGAAEFGEADADGSHGDLPYQDGDGNAFDIRVVRGYAEPFFPDSGEFP